MCNRFIGLYRWVYIESSIKSIAHNLNIILNPIIVFHTTESVSFKINTLAQKYEKLITFSNITYEEVIQTTKNSDVLLLLHKKLDNGDVSPNKIYENLLCGNVIIIRSFLNFANELETTNAGKGFRIDENDKIIEYILDLYNNKDKLNQVKKNSLELGKKYNWEANEIIYKEIYL